MTYGLLCGRALVKVFQARIKRSVTHACHPMLLAVLAAEVALDHNWARMQNISQNLRLVEIQTGHGLGALSMRPNYRIDVGSLPVPLSRLSADVGIQEIYMRSVLKLLHFILDSTDYFEAHYGHLRRGLDQLTMLALRERVQYLLSSSDHRQMMLDDFRQTVQSHFSTVYLTLRGRASGMLMGILQVHNLITQRDSLRNMDLGKDTKEIAAASKRDSSAMKTIAVLTMVFLPGTFVSVRRPSPRIAFVAS